MKTVIIIGASKPGYAEEITKKMLNNGVFVIGTYEEEYAENALNLTRLYSNAKLTMQPLDVSNRIALASFANSIDVNIDGIVYAQFSFSMENPNDFSYEIWDKSLNVNLIAPAFLITTLKKQMNVGSSNVIITSTEAFRGSYGAPAYSATKAAIHNLVKSLANTLGKKQIRINAVPAGWIGGEMDTDEIFNLSRDLTPLGRLGNGSEVASVVSFLFSQESSFVNGTTLITDGGYLCSDPLSKYEFEDANQ